MTSMCTKTIHSAVADSAALTSFTQVAGDRVSQTISMGETFSDPDIVGKSDGTFLLYVSAGASTWVYTGATLNGAYTSPDGSTPRSVSNGSGGVPSAIPDPNDDVWLYVTQNVAGIERIRRGKSDDGINPISDANFDTVNDYTISGGFSASTSVSSPSIIAWPDSSGPGSGPADASCLGSAGGSRWRRHRPEEGPTMKLYHSPQSRSVRPRWLLEEIGVPYDLVKVDLAAGDQKRPEYLKLNPNGTVPTLVDGDLVLFESAAICQHLADKFPEKRLAPPVGTPARGLYYQWIHYAMSGVEPPAVTIFLHTLMKPEAERIPQLVAEARGQLAGVLEVIEQALAGRSFLLGDQFSAADVMVGSTLGWVQMMGLVASTLPATGGYVARLRERPAFQRASAE